MMSRHFCLAMFSVFLVQAGLAAPVAPIVISVQQPDGFSFDVRPRGDEYVSWVETLDGYTVVKEGDTWYYAIQAADGTLVASSNAVGPAPPATRSTLPKHLHPPVDPRAYDPRELRPLSAGTAKSLSHTQYMVVVLVNYSDISFTYSDASFQSLFFGAAGSVHKYFREVSNDKFIIVPAGESFGSLNDGIVHVTRPLNHPNIGKADSRPEAAAIFSLANAYINFSSYDTNGDSTVTPDELAVIFVLAGYEKAYGDDLAYTPNVFAHAWGLANPLALDGVMVQPFAMFGERHQSFAGDLHQSTIGVMCHEAGHLMFGLPDLYDTDYTSDGIGDWGLMGSGMWTMTGTWPGDSPAHLSAWSKAALNITSPVDINTPTTGSTILPAQTNTSVTRVWTDPYRLWKYFLLENRQQTGFDGGLPGNGLIIWDVDDNQTDNADDLHRWVDVEEADGLGHLDLDDMNTGDAGDPYPGSSNNRDFDDTSNPNSRDQAGNSTGVAVTNISDSGLAMTVDITPGAAGDHIRYDEFPAPDGWLTTGGNVIWSAVRYTNNTSMNRLDGFEIYGDTTATVDFYLYQNMVSNAPTTLLHSQTGFSAVAGWNRFLLAAPQPFPAGSDLVIVLRIAQSVQVYAAYDSQGTRDNRSWLDGNGIPPFQPLDSSFTYPGDLHQIALVGYAPPPAVTSIVRADADPTSAASVDFTVTFSGAVTGVDASDFVLTTTGVTGAGFTSISADNGNTRTVTVNTGTGSGTIRLDVVDDDTIVNAASVPLGGSGSGNGNFDAGEVYTVQKTPLLSVTPARVTVGYAAGTTIVTVANSGGGILNWTTTVITGSGWLNGVSPTSGSLAAGQSEDVTIDYKANALACGSPTAGIQFADPAAQGSPIIVVWSQNPNPGPSLPAPSSISYPTLSYTGAFTVTWTAVSGATNYTVERSTDGGLTWAPRTTTCGSTGFSEGVPSGSYRYRVRTGGPSEDWRTGSFDCVVRKEPILSVIPTYWYAGSRAGGLSMTVRNMGGGTLPWSTTVVGGSSWLSCSRSGTLGAGQTTYISAGYSQNTFPWPRMGRIEFTSPVAGTKTLTVVQSGVPLSLNVNIGNRSGGTPVTISGTDFSGLQSVQFGTTPAAIQSATATKIYVTSPPGTGTVPLTVTTASGSDTLSDAFTYIEEKSVPLAAWPVALALGAAAVVALRKRKRS